MTANNIEELFSSLNLTCTDWAVQLSAPEVEGPTGWNTARTGVLSAKVPSPLSWALPSLTTSHGIVDGGKVEFSLWVETFRLDQIWKNNVPRFNVVDYFSRERSKFVVEYDRTLIRKFVYKRLLAEETITAFHSNFVWNLRLNGYLSAFVAEVRISDAPGSKDVWRTAHLLEMAKQFMGSLRVTL